MAKYQSKLNLDKLVAIDVHTHANISQRQPRDPCSIIFDEAMAKYFKSAVPPTIPEVAQYYRERNLAAVIFTVDCEAEMGHTRIANEEVAEVAAEHADVLIPFASIDPAKGKMAAREARRLIEDYGVRGFKFHPSTQGFYPNDRKAYVLYEAIAEAGLPALFHTGQTGA
ncbi:MAG TPA: amidohydrolase family protein, partial [Steroidobacteraceae bacterium]